MKRFRFALWSVLFVTVLAGCGAQENASDNMAGPIAKPMAAMTTARSASASGASSTEAESAGKPASVGAIVQAVSTTPRKIIYTSQVDLVVENLGSAQEKLTRLVKENQGYIAETNIGGQSGERRSGSWKVRIPVENYEAFMAGATRLGELRTIEAKSQDVTAEFYDVEARIANKQVEEKRLQELLQKATGKLSEILQVERELSRVRGEIEQLQGRIRVLANLSSLTTVTLTLNEIKDYVPPATPSFRTKIVRVFGGSMKSLSEFCQGVVLFVVGIVPWLPLIALFGFPLWRVWKRSQIQGRGTEKKTDGR